MFCGSVCLVVGLSAGLVCLLVHSLVSVRFTGSVCLLSSKSDDLFLSLYVW